MQASTERGSGHFQKFRIGENFTTASNKVLDEITPDRPFHCQLNFCEFHLFEIYEGYYSCYCWLVQTLMVLNLQNAVLLEF